jgi:Na+/proline symporter
MVKASPLEWAWTLVAAAGLCFSIWLAVSGYLDLRAVVDASQENPPRARIWGPRYWVALSSWCANGTLCVIWVGFILIGAVAMQYPPPPPTVDQTVSNQWVGWVLILMELLLAGVQGWHLFVRGKIEAADSQMRAPGRK